MSARVLNPVALTEICKLNSPKALHRNFSTNRKLNTIKKDLFGSPNPNETKRLFEDELDKHQDLACKKWGFDFRNGYPIIGNDQYIWERVSLNDFIPEMYTLSHAVHIPELPILEATADDILIDARAAKENELSSSNIDFSAYTGNVHDLAVDNGTTQAAYIFRVPIDGQNSRLMTATANSAVAACSQLRKKRRQPKITEFMKERKRLTPTLKKRMSPVKRIRMSSINTSSGPSIIHTPGKSNLFPSGSNSIGRHRRN